MNDINIFPMMTRRYPIPPIASNVPNSFRIPLTIFSDSLIPTIPWLLTKKNTDFWHVTAAPLLLPEIPKTRFLIMVLMGNLPKDSI